MTPWFVAAGMHGLLLFMPLSSKVNLSKSSTAGKVRVMDVTQVPKTQPKAKPTPAIASASNSSWVVAKPKPPAPVKPKPLPTQPKPIAKPATKTATPSAAAARPTHPNTGAKQAKTKQPKPAIASNDLVVNLAQLPDTEPCKQVEGCWKSRKSQWRAVYAKVQEQITAQGFTVTELELEDDTGFRVSQIARSGTTEYYLHLFSTLEGTVYILNPTQLSKDEVEERMMQAEQTG